MNDETMRAAIEAGARALWENDKSVEPSPWEQASDYWREQFLADARVAYDAMAPIIEQATTGRTWEAMIHTTDGEYVATFAWPPELVREFLAQRSGQYSAQVRYVGPWTPVTGPIEAKGTKGS